MKEFYDKLDSYFKEHNINGAKEYLEDSLNNAILEHNTSLIITILNEMIGFLRDISLYEDSYKYAQALLKLVNSNTINADALYVSYINIANSFRANKVLDEAINIFELALEVYLDNNINSINNYAAIYNNLALCYEEKGDYNKALDCLNKALDIIKNSSDQIKIASTYTNMAMCYIALGDLDNAKKALDSASIFEDNKDDFHYSGYAGAYGKYFKMTGDYNKAVYYYEESLSHLLMTVGKNAYYNQIKDELFDLYDTLEKNPHIKGIELSRMYYEATKNELFKKIGALSNSISIGLFGLGSECFGVDDLISEDHDFDPGYIILVNDSVGIDDFNKIKDAYNSLNKCFKRYYVMPLDKKGVHYKSDYLKDFLGVNDINNLSIQSKGLITNGELFYVGVFSDFKAFRDSIIKADRYSYLESLILKTLEINQYIPYNLNRAKQRKDLELYELLKSHLIDRLIEYYYIYHHKYLPHDKLSLKLIDEGSVIKKFIRRIYNNELDGLFEEISTMLLKVLLKYRCIKKLDSIYIEDYRIELIDFIKDYNNRKELIDEIVKLEWDSFKVLDNIGGRATCQNNPMYFKLMREAQFYTWDYDTLNSYLNDLNEAKKYGYNLLAVKYGFMEESVDPIHYEMIKDGLPKLSSKQIALREEIVKIQCAAKLDYDKLHSDYKNMRSNNTSSDNIHNASYETYLRGELSSYSEATMYKYACNLVEVEKRG